VGNHIVSIGEALVDMIEVEDGPEPRYLAAWGGSPFNVAVGAARLGVPAEFAGSFSADALGSKLLRFLEEQGVGVDLCSSHNDVHTTIAMTSFVNAEPHYAFYANPASYGKLTAAIATRQQIASAAVVHSGSLAVVEDSTFEAVQESFHATGGLKTFDPNVRPRMVDDWDEYRRRLGILIHQAHFVKYSAEDIDAAYPSQTEEAIALATLDDHTEAVMITRGGSPVSLYSHDTHTTLPLSTTFPVVDTTGGGDATMATIIAQLAQSGLPSDHAGWVHMAKQALIVANIVSSRRGGAIAMPTASEARAAGAELAAS